LKAAYHAKGSYALLRDPGVRPGAPHPSRGGEFMSPGELVLAIGLFVFSGYAFYLLLARRR
jgi:hypothetical protein